MPRKVVRRRAAAMALAVLVVAASVVAVVRVTSTQDPALPAPVAAFVSVPDAPGSADRIRIDTALYRPASPGVAPAVLLAHAFGQDEDDLAPEARRLQRAGYIVLAYSARGFGRSGGLIGLDALDGEVADARALVDVLDRRSDVLHRRGDPVVGVVGASYGGALALMLGATDPRIDTVVAGITWHDLGQALDPWTSGWARGVEPERTFKSAWSARLFGTGAADSPDPCARFTQRLCTLYQDLVTGGSLSASDEDLLQQSSPSSVLDGMRAPTLLLQGLQDSLFTLRQADRNARQIARAGAPVQVQWFDGGHDGGGTAGTEQTVDDWLDARLRHPSEPVSTRFTYAVPAGATSFEERHSTARYPGLDPRSTELVPLDGTERTVVNPPGGQPASVTALPGVGAATDLGRSASGLLGRANPPGQAARFTSDPLDAPLVLTGAARASVRITTTGTTAQDVVLFAQLTARTGSQRRPLPGGVAPVHVRLPPGGGTIEVRLPGTVWRFAPGDRVELTLRTTDSQFLGLTQPASFRLASDAVELPVLAAAPSAGTVAQPTRGQWVRIGVLGALALLLVAGLLVAGRTGRAAALRAEQDGAASDAPPLVVRGLTKRFRSGFVAVDAAAFTVERGQVVGLLGENGAGKTTTMRMLLGLSRPDAGTIEAFGVPVAPGSPVLRRIGAFIEGPGFLPHLSGRRNLALFWAATGRPRREARLAEALAVADLGAATRRRVGGYSQGMRQRLAIAQTMLGMPDLLVLDEPTNGLDPTQIVALRDVLRRYAASGRTVVVSSHLLGEVEQTCTHVVVMSRGRVVAAGPVAEVAGGAEQLVVEVSDAPAAVAALQASGVAAEDAGAGVVRVGSGAHRTAEVVAVLDRADVDVVALRRERRLEDAFLDLVADPEPA